MGGDARFDHRPDRSARNPDRGEILRMAEPVLALDQHE